jgi:hypothetical protein
MSVDTVTGNKLIAEFLDLYVTDFNGTYHFVCKEEQKNKALNQAWLFRLEEAKYHESLDCLMPVIEKIESIGYDTGICGVEINGEKLTEVLISPIEKAGKIEIHIRQDLPKITATWQAVVQFIQWYNSLTKKDK